MDSVFGAGDLRHECTHLARFEHSKRATRPGLQGPSLDKALFELRANHWKRVGDEPDPEFEAVVLAHVEHPAADRSTDGGAEDPARAHHLIVGRVPDLRGPVGAGRSVEIGRPPETASRLP